MTLFLVLLGLAAAALLIHRYMRPARLRSVEGFVERAKGQNADSVQMKITLSTRTQAMGGISGSTQTGLTFEAVALRGSAKVAVYRHYESPPFLGMADDTAYEVCRPLLQSDIDYLRRHYPAAELADKKPPSLLEMLPRKR